MDFKLKLRTFIEDSKQKLLSPQGSEDQDSSLPSLVLSPEGGLRRCMLNDSDREVSQLLTDPQADQDILDLIHPEYYSQEFCPSQYELERLPERFDQASIDRDRKLLLQQLTVVSKRVFKLILERQTSCSLELEQIVGVQVELLDAVTTCKAGRGSLARAQKQFVNSSLGILAGCRRRQQALVLRDNLTIIQTLQKTEEKLQELLLEEKYPEAIRVLLECQNVASNYRHFHSIRQLSSKLQDTLVMAEEQLDVALAKVSTSFNTNTYSKLQDAYKMLGKTQTAMDQLLMHVTSAIHNKSWNLIHSHAVLAANSNIQDLSKRPYPELCQTLTVDLFLPCLLDLSKSLWDIMLNYRKILAWHRENDVSITATPPHQTSPGGPDQSTASIDEAEELETQLQRQYIEKKLECGLIRIWQDVQTKIRVLVLASNLSEFSIDLFIQFLDIIHRLIRVGREFSGGSAASDTLEESLQKQCLAYFRAYHHSRLDELRTHLENEAWALCPVRPNLSFRSLVEFFHLRILPSAAAATTVTSFGSGQMSPSKRAAAMAAATREQSGGGPSTYFTEYWDSPGTPFDDVLMDGSGGTGEEEILVTGGGGGGGGGDRYNEGGHGASDSDEEDLSEEQKQEILEENEEPSSVLATLKKKVWTPPPPKQGLCLANTTLMILRLFGRYSHLMQLLHPIAGDIILGMSQVFQFYVYSVFHFFVDSQSDIEYSDTLKIFLNKVEDEVILRHAAAFTTSPEDGTMPISSLPTTVGFVPPAFLSPAVELNRRESLYGLYCRIVAVESCVFLADQLTELRPYLLQQDLQPAEEDTLARFFAETVSVVTDLRQPVYYPAVARTLELDPALALMARVSWDLKEVRSQHSDYVDFLLRGCQAYAQKLARTAAAVPVSQVVMSVLWTVASRVAANLFVEGFSAARKCTNEGRALMQLDYRQFVLKLETMSGLRPLPHQEFVTAYIKAYYIPESELEAWVETHREYSTSQLVALVNSVAYSNNKTRQKLNSLINDLSSRIRR